MKKIMFGVLAVVGIGAALAWVNRIDLMLALIRYQTDQQQVAPYREVQWGAGPAMATAPASQRPPNVILIVADDLGINDISTFGGGIDGGKLQTPNIDRLAAEGANFTQSYSGASTCAPSRGMMMTGRYPTRTGFEFTPTPPGMGRMATAIADSMHDAGPAPVYDAELDAQQPPYENKGLPPEEVTLAEVLAAQGYYTAHIGKWHLGRTNGMAPTDQGFDDSLLMASGLYLPENHPDVVNAKLDFDPIDQFLWASMSFAASFNDGDRFEPGGYLTDYWTDESLRVIDANQHRPFFLYLAHWGPHTPLQATRADYEAVGDIQPHRKRVYAGMVHAVDRSVGRILDHLEARGLADNTIVMFTSDNGGAGYIGIPEVNEPFRGWKITMFEGGIRVPLFVRWPTRIAAGTEVEQPVAHIDLMPTVAAATGAQLPEGVEIDGKNLLALTDEPSAANWNREILFWQNGGYRVVRKGDWKLQVNPHPDGTVRYFLFNLGDDPTEQNNLADSNPDRVAELAALIEAHNGNRRPLLFEATVQMPVMVDKTLADPYTPGDEYVYTPN